VGAVCMLLSCGCRRTVGAGSIVFRHRGIERAGPAVCGRRPAGDWRDSAETTSAGGAVGTFVEAAA
jgi:hypothetical protein